MKKVLRKWKAKSWGLMQRGQCQNVVGRFIEPSILSEKAPDVERLGCLGSNSGGTWKKARNTACQRPGTV